MPGYSENLPECVSEMRRETRVIGEVTDPKTIARILAHVKARERHARGPRAPPVLLASLFHLQHVQSKALALSLRAGLVQ